MNVLPLLKPQEVIRKLRRAGFVFDRSAKGGVGSTLPNIFWRKK